MLTGRDGVKLLTGLLETICMQIKNPKPTKTLWIVGSLKRNSMWLSFSTTQAVPIVEALMLMLYMTMVVAIVTPAAFLAEHLSHLLDKKQMRKSLLSSLPTSLQIFHKKL